MKEVTYLHAEGIQGGFLKHGTIALVDKNLMSLFFLPPSQDKELYESTLNNLNEVKSRHGVVIAFHFEKKLLDVDNQVILPESPILIAPLVQLVAGQLMAYFTAVILKRDIDKPRNLAKSVTVP